ncbi:hypothetical protein F5877DRAFT_73367 [Lentinula edodes]|nr:hypothetical protein F5877DRAFT_73367 [Lentinula edodes]
MLALSCHLDFTKDDWVNFLTVTMGSSKPVLAGHAVCNITNKHHQDFSKGKGFISIHHSTVATPSSNPLNLTIINFRSWTITPIRYRCCHALELSPQLSKLDYHPHTLSLYYMAMPRFTQRECPDEVSPGWVEIFPEGVESQRRECQTKEGHGDEQSERQDESDENGDEYLASLTLTEQQQQWIDLGSYIVQKLRMRLKKMSSMNKLLVEQNSRLHDEIAALKQTVGAQNGLPVHIFEARSFSVQANVA